MKEYVIIAELPHVCRRSYATRYIKHGQSFETLCGLPIPNGSSRFSFMLELQRFMKIIGTDQVCQQCWTALAEGVR